MRRDRQIAGGLDWPERERRTGRESVCACWRTQEPAPGVCAGGSILSVCVWRKERISTFWFLNLFPLVWLSSVAIISQN